MTNDSDTSAAPQEDWDLPPWTPGAFDLEKELAVNPKLNEDDLEELRNWISTKSNLPLLEEAELVKFLHSCEYDVKAAQSCIQSYYSMRGNAPELFCNRDITSDKLAATLDLLDVMILPKRLPDGTRVFFTRLKHIGDSSPPSRYVFADHQKIMLMIMDACLLAEPTVPSFYFMYDLHLGQVNHFWRFGLWLQRKLFAYFQSGLPLLLRGVILVHTPAYINSIMKVLSAFVNRQRLESTHMLAGDDYSSLHDLIPKDCLPTDYGGTLGSVEELHDMTVKRLANLKDYFREEEEKVSKAKKK